MPICFGGGVVIGGGLGNFTVGIGAVLPQGPGLGGTITSSTSGIYPGTSWIHIFTSSGQFTASTQISINYLVVGGGGGGGAGGGFPSYPAGGGGGAGGMIAGATTLCAGTYNITVGGGGAQSPGPGIAGTPSHINLGAGPAIVCATGGGGGGWGANPIAPSCRHKGQS